MLYIDIFKIVHRPKQIQDQSAINHFEFKWEFSYLHVPTVYFASLRIFDYIRFDDTQSKRIIFCSLNREQEEDKKY